MIWKLKVQEDPALPSFADMEAALSTRSTHSPLTTWQRDNSPTSNTMAGPNQYSSPSRLLRPERSDGGRIDRFDNKYTWNPERYPQELFIRPLRDHDYGMRHNDRLDTRSYPQRRRTSDTRVPHRAMRLPGHIDSFLSPKLRLTNIAAAEEREAVPFESALTMLLKRLEQAERFFTMFQAEYDEDISGVKRYATAIVLTDLWILKVKGRKDGQECLESQDGGEDCDSAITAGDMFRKMRKIVPEALERVLNSAFPDGGRSSQKQTRLDSVKRLRKKVETAKEQIIELLNKAPKRRDECAELIREFGLLKALIHASLSMSMRPSSQSKNTRYSSLLKSQTLHKSAEQETATNDNAEDDRDEDSQTQSRSDQEKSWM